MIAAIVLAAGQSKRMGKPKLLLPLGGSTILGLTLQTFRKSKVDKIVLVLGSDSAEVREGLSLRNVRVLVNKAYRKGMSGSIRMGVREVEKEADAAIIALGDQPFVSPNTVDLMIEAYLRKKPAVVAPVYRGTRGNPVLFDRSVFRELVAVTGDVGAKSVVKRHEGELVEVEVDDEGVVMDIDTPGDYARGSSMRESTERPRSPGRV